MRIRTDYDRLASYLAALDGHTVEMTFRDIEGILGGTLPPSARRHLAWWSNTQPHARAWTLAGRRAARVDVTNEKVRFERDGTAGKGDGRPRRGRRSAWDQDAHLAALDKGFEKYLEACARRRIFTGPSVHFYDRAVERVRAARRLEDLAGDQGFQEAVYATLTAWGMHRMGETVTAKLTEFPTFREALDGLVAGAAEFHGRSITDVSEAEALPLTRHLARLVARPGITASGAPLVANTKTLHFLLPDLVPPMDRTYTCRFFFGSMNPAGGADHVFATMMAPLHGLAIGHADVLRKYTGSYLCNGHAKGLDNAIVGYVLSHPSLFGKPKSEEAAP